ncbi:MAG: pyridoxal phosphate-dependent aminotransferase [Sandaracinaceae bacterium]
MRLAVEVGAINLAQGRPDFPAAEPVKAAAIAAIQADHNQYSVTWGLPALRQAVSAGLRALYGIEADPEREITITCGVTEGLVGAMLATMESGDEVLVIEPAHENYVPAIRFAGAVPRAVPLEAPDFDLDVERLADAVGPRTRALILNTPHNPTGRVLSKADLMGVAEVCARHDLLLITDEIYDRLTYDGLVHVPPCTLPGMAERTITCGGISKIHCVTGWRLGYVVAPPPLTEALRVVHDYLTICAPTPLQHGALAALAQPSAWYDELRARFVARRAQMMATLAACGFAARPPEGAYYVMAGFEGWTERLGIDDGEELAEHLIREARVATVPGAAFYVERPELGWSLIRFAFAKTEATLTEVRARLEDAYARAGA